jgi:excisionase family DNA binding protein
VARFERMPEPMRSHLMYKNAKQAIENRLLDIREAADFLHVSEMSIRRWTNSGALKCFRVGGKRERRFHMADLEDFLKGSSGSNLRPLGFWDLRAQDGAHLTHFYSGKKEALEVSTAYVAEGLKRGERVLAVMPPERSRELMANLNRQGIPVKHGQLLMSEGMDSPEAMIRYLGSIVEEPGPWRLMGDGAWTLRKKWDLEAIKTLEKAGESLDSKAGRLFLCQYSLEDFSGAHIMMAAEMHSHVIYKGGLVKSLYYKQTLLSNRVEAGRCY